MVNKLTNGRIAYPVTRHFSHNLVFYRGPTILGIAGQATSNPKTGSVVQVWELRSDISPIHAMKTGGDRAICGPACCRSLKTDQGTDLQDKIATFGTNTRP
jgi:hypothetical protein